MKQPLILLNLTQLIIKTMGTATDQKTFLQSLTLGEVTNFRSDNLKIEISKQRTPLKWQAKYFHKVGEGWQKFSDFVSNYVGDVIQDCKQEKKLY